jgi:hypothetical protein
VVFRLGRPDLQLYAGCGPFCFPVGPASRDFSLDVFRVDDGDHGFAGGDRDVDLYLSRFRPAGNESSGLDADCHFYPQSAWDRYLFDFAETAIGCLSGLPGSSRASPGPLPTMWAYPEEKMFRLQCRRGSRFPLLRDLRRPGSAIIDVPAGD